MKESFGSVNDYLSKTEESLVSDSQWNTIVSALNETRAQIGSVIQADAARYEDLARALERTRESEVQQAALIDDVEAQLRDYTRKLDAANQIHDMRVRASLPPLEDLERAREDWADIVRQLEETRAAQDESLASIQRRADEYARDPRVMAIEEQRAYDENSARTDSNPI
jgi:chromosome segregation ATPase